MINTTVPSTDSAGKTCSLPKLSQIATNMFSSFENIRPNMPFACSSNNSFKKQIRISRTTQKDKKSLQTWQLRTFYNFNLTIQH